MPKNTQSPLTNNEIDFPTQHDEVSVISMPVFFLICISYLCLESKLSCVTESPLTDLLFRKCRHEVEYFSTAEVLWEHRLLKYARLHEGEMFLSHFFSAVMGISVSQGCRLVSRCDHKTSRSNANISLYFLCSQGK